jgi:hypothetical protein
MATNGGGMTIRMPEDITTYATLPKECYMPTPEKPWQGIWCGDYSGHGCEFILIQQPDPGEERPLPEGMDWLQSYFRGDHSVSDEHSEGHDAGQSGSEGKCDVKIPSLIDRVSSCEPQRSLRSMWKLSELLSFKDLFYRLLLARETFTDFPPGRR